MTHCVLIVAYLNLADNRFNGSVDFASVVTEMETLIAINLTNNQFKGTFPCLSNNKQLEYVDIRGNHFNSIETQCQWPNSLEYFLASYNPRLEQSFDEITYNMYNMTVLALGLTSVYGIVNKEPIYNGGQYLAFYDSEIATKLPGINPTAMWNQSWVVIGLTIEESLPFWVSSIERQLRMILVPKYDRIKYLAIY